MAPLLRVRPELQEVCRFASQWDAVHEAEPPAGPISYRDEGTLPLGTVWRGAPPAGGWQPPPAPHGDAHVVRSPRRGGSSGIPVRIEYNNAIRIKTNTRDESDTELICGRLHFDAVPDSLVIAALPKRLC